MSEPAFVILAAGDEPESLGRGVNTLMGALEAGEAPMIIFDGAGAHAAAAFAEENHQYHEHFQKVEKHITGACSDCAGAYEVRNKQNEKAIPNEGREQPGHP